MSQLSMSPYINFNGHARKAMEFYQAALGGELTLLAFNEGGAPKPAGPDDAIMHAFLDADGAKIMGSDGMVEYPAKVGDNFAVALSGTDTERMTKAFEMLSAGGNVKQNLKEESWGDTFGWFEDKFGINWMVNINKSEN